MVTAFRQRKRSLLGDLYAVCVGLFKVQEPFPQFRGAGVGARLHVWACQVAFSLSFCSEISEALHSSILNCSSLGWAYLNWHHSRLLACVRAAMLVCVHVLAHVRGRCV